MRVIAAVLALCAMSAASEARVVRLEITSTQPYGSFGSGEFVRTEGRVVGELSPDEPIPGCSRPPAPTAGPSLMRRRSC